VVLRKGKRETLKGLSLPEARPERAREGFPRGFPGAAPRAPVAGGKSVMTTVQRTNDRFTARHREGDLDVTVTGKVEGGKAVVGEVTVQDGGESHRYGSVDDVPERYRDKVHNLVELSEGGPKGKP